jgi:transposase
MRVGVGKLGSRKLICSGCGRKTTETHDYNEREDRDLPRGEYRTTVVIEVYRVCCPGCGVEIERVPQVPSKAGFRERIEEAVGKACESALGNVGGPVKEMGVEEICFWPDDEVDRGRQPGERGASLVRSGPQARNAR